MSDIFTSFEYGLAGLLKRLGIDHPRLTEAHTYQFRLIENISLSRKHGNTETLRHERSVILERLNQLALETLGVTFHDLCQEGPELPFSPEFVTVPAGEFIMGTNKTKVRQAHDYEMPEHKVYLTTYQISKTPVTNELYLAFVQESGHRQPKHWPDGRIPVAKRHHPVVNVSWEGANKFCHWLSRKIKADCRLPTEAEWEKAARGSDGRIYPWGNEWDKSKLNCRENGPKDTTAVGFYFQEGDSPYGAVDLCGNVWEWCLDWFREDEYKERQGTVTHNPGGPDEGQRRSVRGSTFSHPKYLSRATKRSSMLPAVNYIALGFRCVIESEQ